MNSPKKVKFAIQCHGCKFVYKPCDLIACYYINVRILLGVSNIYWHSFNKTLIEEYLW